jgi:hypothetical protein
MTLPPMARPALSECELGTDCRRAKRRPPVQLVGGRDGADEGHPNERPDDADLPRAGVTSGVIRIKANILTCCVPSCQLQRRTSS